MAASSSGAGKADAKPTPQKKPAAAAPPSESGQASPPAAKPTMRTQPVHRAGGHIDRGDGRGWVVEDIDQDEV